VCNATTCMASWSPPATRAEAVARVGDLFPDNLEGQGRVFRALARLRDGEVVNLFGAPSREAVEATLMNVLAESTGESCLGTVGWACHLWPLDSWGP
jgi:hypothetical protein